MSYITPTYITNDFFNPDVIRSKLKQFCVKLSEADNLDSVKLLTNCIGEAKCVAVEPNFILRLEDIEENYQSVITFLTFCSDIGQHSNYRVIVPFTTNLTEMDRNAIMNIANDMPKYPNIRVCIKNGQYVPNSPKEIMREPQRIPTITKIYNLCAEEYATVGLDIGYAEQTIRNSNLLLEENDNKKAELQISDYIAAYKEDCRNVFVSHIKRYEHKKSDFDEENANILRDEWLFPIHSFFDNKTRYIIDIRAANAKNSIIFSRETKIINVEENITEE